MEEKVKTRYLPAVLRQYTEGTVMTLLIQLLLQFTPLQEHWSPMARMVMTELRVEPVVLINCMEV